MPAWQSQRLHMTAWTGRWLLMNFLFQFSLKRNFRWMPCAAFFIFFWIEQRAEDQECSQGGCV